MNAEFFITLIFILVLGLPAITFGWLIYKVRQLNRRMDALSDDQTRTVSSIRDLKDRLTELETRRPTASTPAAAAPTPAPITTPKVAEALPPIMPAVVPPVMPVETPVPSTPSTPPVLPRSVWAETVWTETPQSSFSRPMETPPRMAPPVEEPFVPEPERPAFNLEQYLGVKLFAWVGGIALFLGIAFFLKYSFENNLVPPEVRIAMGYLVGIGLLAGGLFVSREKYAVTVQSLCATGILVLYGVTFSAHSLYDLMPREATFGVMSLVTIAAFLLAVRLDAQSVAILGLLGGFLSPLLFSTGKDNPVGLFSYISLLNIGLVAVALHKRWNHLVFMGAIGTLLMEVGWAEKFFGPEKAMTASCIVLSMNAIFLLASWIATRRESSSQWDQASAIIMGFLSLICGWKLLCHPELASAPYHGVLTLLLADLGLVALILFQPTTHAVQYAAGTLVFLALGSWTGAYLNPSLLQLGMIFYMVFAVLHSILPVVLHRRRPELKISAWTQLFPMFALLMLFIHLLKATQVGAIFWGGVLLTDLLAVVLALLSGSLLSLGGVLILTLCAIGTWMFRIPHAHLATSEWVMLLGGFTLFFFVTSILATRRVLRNSTSDPTLADPEKASLIPAMSGVLPFILLMMACSQFPMPNPSPIFGLGLLLVVLLLGLGFYSRLDALTAISLVCITALEYLWHGKYFDFQHPWLPIFWHALFTLVFTLYPFLFTRSLLERPLPWVCAALAGPAHFYAVYHSVERSMPNNWMGLLPAIFVIPPLLALMILLPRLSSDNPHRNSILAWFGGVALFFITLIFPVQFEKEMWTLGWALEGAALLWLHHRIPHRGLKLAAFFLLGTVFLRLTVNPAVLSYHPRSATPILNWYLYTYGIVTACLFTAGRLLKSDPDGKNEGSGVFQGMGVILAFLLMNIEIADYFSTGYSITFQFSGNLARGLAYSISWALFALGLLIAGMARKIPVARYASIVLLGITLLKLFFHDLGHLSGLYKSAAFVGVAMVLMLASWLLQRFLSNNPTSEKSS